MDIVGSDDITAELELLAAASAFFKRLGIGPEDVGIKVNSRKVLEMVIRKAGVIPAEDSPEMKDATKRAAAMQYFQDVCVVIDKLDKIGDICVKADLMEKGVPASGCDKILSAMKAKTIDELAVILGGACPATDDMKRLFDMAKGYGMADYLVFDASVVRGLSYYTGMVWEAFDRRGVLRAVMGGGRYDKLLAKYSGEKVQISCCGFGFGDCVIVELLKELGKMPTLTPPLDYVVAPFSPTEYPCAAGIAAGLRDLGFIVDLMMTPKKNVGKCFDYANGKGAYRMVFVAPDEVERGMVRVKGLYEKDAAGESVQVDCPIAELFNIDGLIAAKTVTTSDTEKWSGGSSGGMAATKTMPDAAMELASALSGPASGWDVAQVGVWLTSEKLGQHTAVFAANEITGGDLLDLCQDDLLSMEVEPCSARKAIIRAAAGLV